MTLSEVPSGRRSLGFDIGTSDISLRKQRERNSKYFKAKRLYYQAFGHNKYFHKFLIENGKDLDRTMESLNNYITSQYYEERL